MRIRTHLHPEKQWFRDAKLCELVVFKGFGELSAVSTIRRALSSRLLQEYQLGSSH